MFNGNYQTAVQNLRLSKWRTFFTMLGIIIGITSVVTVVSLGEGLKHQITGQINQLGSDVITVRPGKLLSKDGNTSNLNLYALLVPSTLSNKDVESINRLSIVRDVTPVQFVTSSASSDKGEFDDVFVAGTGPNFADTAHQKLAYGGYFTDDDSSGNFAVIGSGIAAEMFGELNPVGETVTVMGQDFIVRGVLAPTQGGLLSLALADYNSSIFIPSDTASNLTAGHTNILQILTRIKPNTNIDKAVSDINAVLAKNHGGSGDFTVLKQNQLLGVSSQVLNTITGFVSSIAAISLLVGGIGIMNIMYVSVTERTKEIGLRMSIGARGVDILLQFLTEAILISFTGGLIGVVLGVTSARLVTYFLAWPTLVTEYSILLSFLVCFITGVFFGYYPAQKASRLDPIEALRYE
jgi:putative ABC transport system permease protein